SLRQAIKDADPGDTIVFDIPTSDPGFNPNTGATYITLVSGPLLISKDLTVRGTGARIVIQRSSAQGISLTSVLKIVAGTVELDHLTITGGYVNNPESARGGAIENAGTLTLRSSTLSG